jgi:hypothetical protein
MADALGVLGQSNPAAAVLTDLYTVTGVGKTAAISSIVVCNTGSATASFRISVAKAGATDTLAQYLYYNLPISGYNTFIATIGISLAATDVVRIYASNIYLTFNVFGVEVT